MDLIKKIGPKELQYPNLIFFALGDWSGDGHDHCAYALVNSNLTFENLRTLHFMRPELGDLYSKPDESRMSINSLIKMGFLQELRVLIESNSDEVVIYSRSRELCTKEMSKLIQPSISDTEFEALFDENAYDLSLSLELLMQIWLMGLKAVRPQTELLWVQPPSGLSSGLGSLFTATEVLAIQARGSKPIPTLHFYGVDSQGRHLKVPGYGLFDLDSTQFFTGMN